jgi:muramoyltetrapeptide carboxypeptidase
LIGFSDLTFLHLYLNQKWGWPTIHGDMPCSYLKNDKNNFVQIQKMIKKEKGCISYKKINPENHSCSSCSQISGTSIGGNLEILTKSLGTRWQLNADGKILLIEDVGVKSYQIDRNLMHLRQSGALRGVKAIILGEFLGEDKFCKKALGNFAKEMDVPVFSCQWFGHGSCNKPIPLGCAATMKKDTNNQWVITIHYDFSSSQP